MDLAEATKLSPKERKEQFLADNLNEGEEYGGIILGKNGEPDYHLIALPGHASPASWSAQTAWAKSIGGTLPTRREAALARANLPELFEDACYWTCEEYASDSGSAWYQPFNLGIQGTSRKGTNLRARAFRRLVIE